MNAQLDAQQHGDFWASKRRLDAFRKGLALAVILALSLAMLAPLLWMLATSLKAPQNVFQMPPWKVDWRWSNYLDAWYPLGRPEFSGGLLERFSQMLSRENFWWYLGNTLLVTVLSTLGAVFTASLVAFGFARLRFPGKDWLFYVLIGTMMVPGQVTMIPNFFLFAQVLGWFNTLLPLIVPAWFGGGAYNVFLLRQFFLGLPRELDEAAKIDGCSTFGIYWRILLPLSAPALITVAVFAVVYNWNDFMGPMIYVTKSELFTLALGLNNFSSLAGDKTNLMMAAAAVVLLPILVLFLVGQKYFIQGIATTGLKG